MTAPVTSDDLRRIADDLRGISTERDVIRAARLAVASLDGLASRMKSDEPMEMPDPKEENQ